MLFPSSVFLSYFLPACLGVYFLAPARLRNAWLLIASWFFYGWWRPDFVALMVFSTLVDFACGLRISVASSPRVRRAWLVVSVVTNLGLLGYFKYSGFLAEVLGHLTGSRLGWPAVILPVGISFYTFQSLSYTIDVYRGAVPATRNLIDFACYIAMFPQLVAGPIVRYSEVSAQLGNPSARRPDLVTGIFYFQAGLAKKVLLADTLKRVADAAFADPLALSAPWAWLGVVAFAFQIYFDFSGYSDMAIGLGWMMGFRLPVNFDAPYRAASITEFWRRWHISLSTWLRDYLYVPLGGNRRGLTRTRVNLIIVMLLGGLWHGAAWTFVAWGGYQGLLLLLERRWDRRSPFASREVAVATTFLLTLLGWVLFRSDTVGDAWTFYSVLAGAGAGGPLPVTSAQMLALGIGVVAVWAAPTTQRLVAARPAAYVVILQALFVFSVLQIDLQQHVPFLYYRF